MVLLLVIFLAVYNFIVLSGINKESRNILDKELPMLVADTKLVTTMYERMTALRGYLLTGEDHFKDTFHETTERAVTYQETLQSLDPSEKLNELIQETVSWRNFIVEDVFNEYDKGNEEQARENILAVADRVTNLVNGYEELAQKRENEIIVQQEYAVSKGEKTILIVNGVSIAVVFLGLAIAVITSNSISKPVRVVMKRMKLIASGDLSEKPLETNLRDEIGELVQSTNEMNDTTAELLNQITVVSETVSSQSEELTQSANEVKMGAEQVAATMEELASGSELQANNASDLSTRMELFATTIDDVSQDGERIQTVSNSILTMTEEGSVVMESSTQQMGVIDKIVHDAVEKVEGLDAHTQQISELVSVIQDIADQTNLLALNAAIEAARVGEHGKGFAVVANEVKKLAEQSSTSVMNITDIVSNIQSESSAVALSLRESYSEVEEGTNQMLTTGKTFQGIRWAVTEMANNIKSVSDNLANIAENSQTMNNAIQEIAAVSEESAAGVEETTASTQQTSGSMEEIAQSSRDLAKLATELNGLVGHFKLS